MASTSAKAQRNFIARERLEGALAILSGSLGVERASESPTRPVRDRELKQIIQLEEIGTFLEAVISKLGLTPEVVESDEGEAEVVVFPDAEKIAAYHASRSIEETESTVKPKVGRRSKARN